MAENAVTIERLSHAYGKIQALTEISLQIPRGISVGLIGPDGVGKSTLLSLIAGVKIVQQGNLLVFGKDILIRRMNTTDISLATFD